jgi:hypothetical protein
MANQYFKKAKDNLMNGELKNVVVHPQDMKRMGIPPNVLKS